MIMQRIFVVGIMAFLSLMMTVEASDTTRSLYDRFGVYCSLGSGESINHGLSEISKYVLTDMSESAFVLDLGFFGSRHGTGGLMPALIQWVTLDIHKRCLSNILALIKDMSRHQRTTLPVRLILLFPRFIAWQSSV